MVGDFLTNALLVSNAYFSCQFRCIIVPNRSTINKEFAAMYYYYYNYMHTGSEQDGCHRAQGTAQVGPFGARSSHYP